MEMEKKRKQHRSVEVSASRDYKVWIGKGLLRITGKIVGLSKRPRRAAIITDETAAALFGSAVEESLRDEGIEVCKKVIPPGEASKNMEMLAETLEFLAEEGLDRSDLIVALGGGVVGDLAGFAAAVYLRGVDFVQIPTTFLAAIDSSVGGKTAVDLAAGKNLAGAFHQPLAVICDSGVLADLPREIFCDGAAEGVKYGVLAGGRLFGLFCAGDGGKPGLPAELLSEVVEQCVRIKADIVGRDEFDLGERQLLNLGHTIGHGIEKLSHFQISHGRAVAAGLAVMARGAERTGLAAQGTAGEIEKALLVQGLPITTEFGGEELFAAMLSDKKKRGNSIRIIVPEKIGSCAVRETELEELKRILLAGLPAENGKGEM